MKKITYPIRINKYLSTKGLCSRRIADELISKGQVLINGKEAVLGEIVKKDDKVVLKGNEHKRYSYIAYNKQRSVVTHSPSFGEKDIKNLLKRDDVHPIGRLDKESEGLIILSNDGRLTEPMLNPKYAHEREYDVRLEKNIKNSELRKLERGVNIEGYITKPAKTKRISQNKLRITITEGKKHQIRRMLSALGHKIISLKRIRIMNIKLGKLKKGQYRNIKGKELEQLMSSLGLTK